MSMAITGRSGPLSFRAGSVWKRAGAETQFRWNAGAKSPIFSKDSRSVSNEAGSKTGEDRMLREWAASSRLIRYAARLMVVHG